MQWHWCMLLCLSASAHATVRCQCRGGCTQCVLSADFKMPAKRRRATGAVATGAQSSGFQLAKHINETATVFLRELQSAKKAASAAYQLHAQSAVELAVAVTAYEVSVANLHMTFDVHQERVWEKLEVDCDAAWQRVSALHRDGDPRADSLQQPLRLDCVLLDVVQRVSKIKNGVFPLLPGYIGLPLAQDCQDSSLSALIAKAFDQREGHLGKADSRSAFVELLMRQANELCTTVYPRDPLTGEWPLFARHNAGKLYDSWAGLQVHQARGTARPGAQAADRPAFVQQRLQECLQKDLSDTLAELDSTAQEPQPDTVLPSTPRAAGAEMPSNTFATPELQHAAVAQAEHTPLTDEQRALALHEQAIHSACCVQTGLQTDLLPASPFPRSTRPREPKRCTAADSTGTSQVSAATHLAQSRATHDSGGATTTRGGEVGGIGEHVAAHNVISGPVDDSAALGSHAGAGVTTAGSPAIGGDAAGSHENSGGAAASSRARASDDAGSHEDGNDGGEGSLAGASGVLAGSAADAGGIAAGSHTGAAEAPPRKRGRPAGSGSSKATLLPQAPKCAAIMVVALL